MRFVLRTTFAALAVFFPATAFASSNPVVQPGSSFTGPVLERRGVIVLKVPDYQAGRERTLAAVSAIEGWGRGEQTNVNPRGRKHGWLLFTVPAGREALLFSALHRVGKLYVAQITTRDHTSEYEELGRRAEQLKAHEARLSHLLDSPRLRGSDILFIQERTFRAGVDYELLLQRRADLERLGRTTAIQVELFEPGAFPPRVHHQFDPGRSFRNGLANARGKLNGLFTRALSAGAYTVVYAPLWIPGLAVLILAGTWIGRRLARWLRQAAALCRPAIAAPLARGVGRGVTLFRGIVAREHPAPCSTGEHVNAVSEDSGARDGDESSGAGASTW